MTSQASRVKTPLALSHELHRAWQPIKHEAGMRQHTDKDLTLLDVTGAFTLAVKLLALLSKMNNERRSIDVLPVMHAPDIGKAGDGAWWQLVGRVTGELQKALLRKLPGTSAHLQVRKSKYLYTSRKTASDMSGDMQ